MYGLDDGIIRSKLALTSSLKAKRPRTRVATTHASNTAARLLKMNRSTTLPERVSKSLRFPITGMAAFPTWPLLIRMCPSKRLGVERGDLDRGDAVDTGQGDRLRAARNSAQHL